MYAFGEDEGLLWIAMELVHGVTLGDWLETHGTMPLEQFVPFFEHVAGVVHAAHERGIVHRDLKPSNVMVIERDGRLFPKLLDLGIAKVSAEDAGPTPASADEPTTEPLRTAPRNVQRTRTDPAARDPRLTRTSSRIGSSPYMSPEQWTNARAVGPATDIYSLGILTYEALTGRRPFVAESTSEYYRLHLHAEVPPLGGDLTPELDRLIQRALAKDPGARHRDVRELASELRSVLQVQPREQLRSLAAVWDARARSPALLLKSEDLMATPKVVGELERAFVAESRRHAVRSSRIRGFLATSAAALVLWFVWYRGELKTEMAQQVTEATATQAELEQGRQALLHNEPEALPHLMKAYRRDHAPSTAFMLARAMQPRLAEQARFPSTFGRMWSATFSPDGHQVVTTDDKNAQVWDARVHRLLFTLPHGDIVHQAVYSSDGARLITTCVDGAIRIWDAASGALVRELRRNGTRPRYVLVARSPDDRLVAAMDLGVAHVWDVSTGTRLAELRDDARTGSPSLAFSSDGHWLAMSSGNDVHVFDTGTWRQVLTIPGPGIDGVSWDPMGPWLLTGSTQGDASIWAVPSARRVHHLREVGEPVDAVAFSPDGRRAIAASREGAEQVWDATSGKLQSQGNYLRGKIRAVEFDPTSALVVAAGTGGALAVADAAHGTLVSMLEGPRNVVMVAHFDSSAQRVVGASWDGTARIWDTTSPYHTWRSPPVSHDCGLVTSLEPDQRFLAIGCKDHPTRVWDTARNQLLAELPSVTPTEHDFASAYPAVSAAGDRAAIARGDKVEIYELPGGRLLHTIAHDAPVTTVAFSSAGRDIVSGAANGSLLVTRDSGALLALPRSSGAIDVAGFLPDGRVVAVDQQWQLHVYGPGGAVLANLATSARVRALRMSADGRRLVTVPSFMGTVAPTELWDLTDYQRIAELAEPDGQGPVYSARFVAGGQVVTACGDGAARLWDGATGQLRQTYRGSAHFLADVALSPDGSILLAGDGDGLLRFWDTASGRSLWTMPAHRSHLIGIRVDGDDIVTRGFSGDIARWTLPRPERVIEACSSHEGCAMIAK